MPTINATLLRFALRNEADGRGVGFYFRQRDRTNLILSWVSHAALPQIKLQEHKAARIAEEEQSSASGALFGELQC
jgi:hypothetical protein